MRYSLRRGKTSRWRVLKTILDYLRYRYDLLDMETACRDSLRPLRGRREEDLVQFCREWFHDVLATRLEICGGGCSPGITLSPFVSATGRCSGPKSSPSRWKAIWRGALFTRTASPTSPCSKGWETHGWSTRTRNSVWRQKDGGGRWRISPLRQRGDREKAPSQVPSPERRIGDRMILVPAQRMSSLKKRGLIWLPCCRSPRRSQRRPH